MDCLLPQISASQIRIPGDVCYLPEHRLLIQSELRRLPGPALSDRSAAAALAVFHGLAANTHFSPAARVQDEHERTLTLVGKVFPGLVRELGDVSDVVMATLESTSPSPLVLLHGDAHLGNLYPIVDGRVGIIDLDRVVPGKAEEDLASFLTFKMWIRLREKLDPELVLWELPRFVAIYNSHAAAAVRLHDVYVMLAHKMITERIQRGISRAKISDARDISSFIRLTRRCLEAAKHCDD
jgi:aminoglycoside phosphotransferase (APT) family kinase protein